MKQVCLADILVWLLWPSSGQRCVQLRPPNITRPYLPMLCTFSLDHCFDNSFCTSYFHPPLQSPDLSSEVLWRIVVQVLSESPTRAKLPEINTIEDVVGLVESCSNILVITGAGVSQPPHQHYCPLTISMHSNSA